MSDAASRGLAIAQMLTRVMAEDRGRLLAALMARLRDLQLAEDALQEASISALTHWGRVGVPSSPHGWLLKVALRKAIDRLRASNRAERNATEMQRLSQEEAAEMTPEMIPDDRLRLIFTCCHPALDPKSQVALTLRTLGGLSTPQIAAVFLDHDATIGQRITRAKAKISAAGIPFAVPDSEDWPERLNSVLKVIYLIFTAGYVQGPGLGRDLCEEALFLAELMNKLRPQDAEIEGLLALISLTHSRRAARVCALGVTIALADQDRSAWDPDLIESGLQLIDTALRRANLGPFQIKAAIAACHVKDTAPDWPQIAALYHVLLHFEPTAIVRLNHAVAVSQAQGPEPALALLVPLTEELADYQPFHAARADFLSRIGDSAESKRAYARAIQLANSSEDAAFLIQRLGTLP